MIERLMALSPPSRNLVYVAGVVDLDKQCLLIEVRKDNPETTPFKGCELPGFML
jgi:hypothetical protein